jgi:1,4-alpha-glucan branching enzyme
MPGDDWQRRANLRLLFGYQFTVPGKKLLFMGAELGQWTEWDHESSLDWHLLDDPAHAGIAAWVARLNELYRTMPALHQDDRVGSFAWIDCDDREQSVVAYERWGRDPDDVVVVIANFTPVPRPGRRVGVARPGTWTVVADSDAGEFGGSGMRSPSTLGATSVAAHGRAQSVVVDVPPLGLLVLRPTPGTGA